LAEAPLPTHTEPAQLRLDVTKADGFWTRCA